MLEYLTEGIKSLNNYSIGIEISNPGHDYGYKKFSKKQINSVIRLSKFLISKYKISKKNILGHSDVAPNRKKTLEKNFLGRFYQKIKLVIGIISIKKN